MIIAYVMTQFLMDGDGFYIIKLAQDFVFAYPCLGRLAFDQDTTKIITNPNVTVVECILSDELMASILAHPDYGEGAILYDLPNPLPPNGKPNANEYGKRRSYFAKNYQTNNAEFAAMFGTQGNPHTRKQGADNCIEWVKRLPKG